MSSDASFLHIVPQTSLFLRKKSKIIWCIYFMTSAFHLTLHTLTKKLHWNLNKLLEDLECLLLLEKHLFCWKIKNRLVFLSNFPFFFQRGNGWELASPGKWTHFFVSGPFFWEITLTRKCMKNSGNLLWMMQKNTTGIRFFLEVTHCWGLTRELNLLRSLHVSELIIFSIGFGSL